MERMPLMMDEMILFLYILWNLTETMIMPKIRFDHLVISRSVKLVSVKIWFVTFGHGDLLLRKNGIEIDRNSKIQINYESSSIDRSIYYQ